MKIGIQWKLMGLFLLLVVVAGSTLYGYLHHTLNNYVGAEIKNGLASEAKLARIIAGKEIGALRKDAPVISSTIAREVRSRVTVISRSGEVLGDSEVPPADLKQLENHLNRPEVQQALSNGYGESIRYSETLRASMLYVAFPFTDERGEGGVLRLALPLTALDAAKERLNTILLVSLAAVAAISFVISFIFSSIASRAIRPIIGVAERFRTGRFDVRVPVSSSDEMGELATVLNGMADRIESELARVAAEKTRLDTILRGMGEGLMVADAGGRVTLVNPAFNALFATGEEVVGKPLIDITRHPSLNEAFNVVTRTGVEQVEELNLQANGPKTVLTHWVPLLKGERPEGVVAVFHDITHRKKLERIRTDFVANVSHELRTPITIIRGYAETILDSLPGEAGQVGQFVEIIHSQSERLGNLVNDLLALSELESGNLAMEMVPVSLGAVVSQACALLEGKAREKHIRLEQLIEPGLPDVPADRDRIEQVLINLIDNGIKYTPEGRSVTITARDDGESVRVSVADDGLGIPPEHLPRIFERFYRVDPARSRAGGGTGLGLSIVKHIVHLHQGQVGVESQPGKGSTFHVTLKKAIQ